jgi:hypothetical protein
MLLGLAGNSVFAQDGQKNPKLYLGMGTGFDYGGIVGGKVEYLPVKQIGVFAGAGYNLLSLGWNVGGTFKISPDKRFSPNLMVMYGYNGVLVGTDYISDEYEMTSYGITVGANFDLRIGRKHKISAGLLVPIRSSEFRDNYDAAENDSRLEITPLLPIGITIGYNFGF